jgi:hypothetical protein
MNIPAGVRISVTSLVPAGQVVLMPDYSHPETPMFDFGWGPDGITSQPASVPDGRVLACHPDDEQRVRDALAVAQERPQWWEDWQRVQRAIEQAVRAR